MAFLPPSPLRPALFAPKFPSHTQVRHATLIKRPKRPYTFTQLITLSDGSTFLHRTTSPMPIYRSTKDTRNNALWNPSSQKLLNVEEDEMGRLKAFRNRFGRGWDAEAAEAAEEEEGDGDAGRNWLTFVAQAAEKQQPQDGMFDMISGFASRDALSKEEAKITSNKASGKTENAKKK
ncbi:hypothetical protein K402DRAFT_387280 [Aulographum hederae CBS 113979]|uniref:Ribosomal protein bL31m N-terminal domain-containing protein n=1 Tax=Aulographum hederae CBS 113979 TaxID=1176131 RepID=A0A6G1GJE2_9PEZI|nr:hypothetical protein K402DRAFT_387280 [Aulographum hederae CBS 113979]